MYAKGGKFNYDSSIMLLVFSNKNELRLAEDILKGQQLDIEIFQTPKEFSGINLYAVKYSSIFMENVFNALRGHNIITWGSYIYDSSKLQRLQKGLSLLSKRTTTLQTFLENINLTKVVPCLVEANMIRGTADIPKDIAEILPYLNAIMPKATYNDETKTLTFTEDGRIITIYPSKIEMGKIKGISDAICVLSWIKDIINKIYENRDSIEPSTERHVKINAVELYGYLPKTNCKECGELTCLSLAVKVLIDEQKIENCKPLNQPRFSEKRDFLWGVLGAMGYKLP